MKTSVKVLALLTATAAPVLFAVTPEKAATTNAAPAKPAAPAAAGADALFGNNVVAKGKGVSVTQADLDQSLVSIKANYASHGRPIPDQYVPSVERQLLQQLIGIQLLNAQATDADKAAGKAQAQKSYEQFRTISGTDEAFERQLKVLGVSRDQLVAKLNQEATAEAVVNRALKADVTDAEVKKFYEDNPAQFEQPERVRVAHILLTTTDPITKTDLPEDQQTAKKKKMEDILKRARAGENFAKLADAFSEDPGVKENHGEYTFSRQDPFVPEFKTTAFALTKTNEVSDIFKSQFGFHIIKLYEKLPAQKLAYADVSAKIKDYLHQQAVQQKLPDFLKKLEKDANVEILDEKLKPVDTSLTDSPAPMAPPAAR